MGKILGLPISGIEPLVCHFLFHSSASEIKKLGEDINKFQYERRNSKSQDSVGICLI